MKAQLGREDPRGAPRGACGELPQGRPRRRLAGRRGLMARIYRRPTGTCRAGSAERDRAPDPGRVARAAAGQADRAGANGPRCLASRRGLACHALSSAVPMPAGGRPSTVLVDAGGARRERPRPAFPRNDRREGLPPRAGARASESWSERDAARCLAAAGIWRTRRRTARKVVPPRAARCVLESRPRHPRDPELITGRLLERLLDLVAAPLYLLSTRR
jgi:hypothetical protein